MQPIITTLGVLSTLHAARFFPLSWVVGGQCACSEGAACTSPGKHPLIARWQEQATRDPEVLEEWRARWPDANWAIATGARSGIFVLDVDVKEGKNGLAALGQLVKRHGGIPATLTVRTGSGGLHLYFAHPGFPVPCSTGKLGPGLDVRGDGGYVVAPGSLHVSGRRYEVESC